MTTTQTDFGQFISGRIDAYVAWFVTWHRFVLLPIEDPAAALASLTPAEQNEAPATDNGLPTLDKLNQLEEQLRQTLRLVLMKAQPGQPIDRDDDAAVCGKYVEIMAELRRSERAFATAASELDPLTGLRRRNSLWNELVRELGRLTRTDRGFCVAMMDIDHFKQVNDTHGHDVGDMVLRAVADQITRSLRIHDDAFRMGGEEFLICLKEADLETGAIVLERLRRRLESNPIPLPKGGVLPVTASFGLVLATQDMDAETLVKRADEALYQAKKGGRNRIVAAKRK
ncbi:MAG: diguanylate cyclase [Alphaproteobacteria bacterium]|nr:diguanylate cyclase [Alphaproteobacteria bacterium]MBV8548657.1 diguanylate cyclase [Alphaproteobacteria bacterium]